MWQRRDAVWTSVIGVNFWPNILCNILFFDSLRILRYLHDQNYRESYLQSFNLKFEFRNFIPLTDLHGKFLNKIEVRDILMNNENPSLDF